jgi:hypothetical protein
MGAGAPSCTSNRDAPAARRSLSDDGSGTTGSPGSTRGIEITPLPGTTVTAGPDPPVNARPDASSAAVNVPPEPKAVRAIYGAPVPQMQWEKRRPKTKR